MDKKIILKQECNSYVFERRQNLKYILSQGRYKKIKRPVIILNSKKKKLRNYKGKNWKKLKFRFS